MARHLKPKRASKKLRARVRLPGGHALPTDWGHGQNKLSRFPTGRGGHTVAKEKGEKTGHLALSLCFLLGSGGVCAGEDSCLPRSPQKERLCQWPGACSAAVTLGALCCSGSGLAWLAPASGHRQARGLDHQVLAWNIRGETQDSWLFTRLGSWGAGGAGAHSTEQARGERCSQRPPSLPVSQP